MRVVYREQVQLAYADWSVTDLELAKQMAAKAIETGKADSVDIIDDDGKLLYQQPRATSPMRRQRLSKSSRA